MKRAYLLVSALVAFSSVGFAAPMCVTGDLDSYLGLAGSGCMIGGATFSGFSSFAGSDNSSLIPNGDVSVTPFQSGMTSGLIFGLNATAGVDKNLRILIQYSVSAPQIQSASNSIGGFRVSGDGAVTSTENICRGGSFTPGTVEGCGGAEDALIAFAIDAFSMSKDTRAFAAGSALSVVTDISADGGTEGSASVTSVTNTFGAVPEPGTSLLCAAGLGWLAWKRRSSIRQAGRNSNKQ